VLTICGAVAVAEDLVGEVEEAVGEATHDDDLTVSGQGDRTEAHIMKAATSSTPPRGSSGIGTGAGTASVPIRRPGHSGG
jgi:hypothetical protein